MVVERPPVANPEQTWRDRQPGLQGLDRWKINGRVGMRGSRKTGQASLVWVRDRDTHRINLFGFLGSGRMILTQDPRGAQLRDSKKRTYTAGNAQQLLFETTGWDIPFDDLKFWVTGLPAPSAPKIFSLDAWGRLATLRQSGWEVRFLEYRRKDGYELPRKVFLQLVPGTGKTAPDSATGNEKVEIRLVIKRWRLNL